jgi:hypothetical protein
VQVAPMRRLWFRCCCLYTFFGSVTAALLGLLIGAAGSVLSEFSSRQFASGVVLGVATLLALREAGVLRFAIPQRKCQTIPTFRQEFGLEWASAMWGAHLGFGVTTWITFGGFWLLVAVCLFLGDPRFAVVVMVTYWLGRTLTVWTAPLLLPRESPAGEAASAIRPAGYQRLSTAALAWSCVLSGLMFFGRL